jgi:hypothetical protein
MQIDLQFDQSVSNASSRRIASINEAANFLDNIITDPITVTMDIGDGEVESQILGQNVLDATIPGGFQVTYDQLVSALKANRGGRYLRPTICLTPLWVGSRGGSIGLDGPRPQSHLRSPRGGSCPRSCPLPGPTNHSNASSRSDPVHWFVL